MSHAPVPLHMWARVEALPFSYWAVNQPVVLGYINIETNGQAAVMRPRRQGNWADYGRPVGYARVSTGEQDAEAQVVALKAAGCTMVFQDTASGGNRDRLQLARALDYVGQSTRWLLLAWIALPAHCPTFLS